MNYEIGKFYMREYDRVVPDFICLLHPGAYLIINMNLKTINIYSAPTISLNIYVQHSDIFML